ncbi:MAG: aminopeptidase P family N-terminal domain-containing protein, partial [Candidatus Dormibacteria bacterium]
MNSALRQAHVTEVLGRVHRWLAASGLEGIVFTQPAGVAWVTGGMNPAIDRFSPTDLVWVAVGADGQALITTVIERDRVEEDSSPAGCGFELVAVPWFGDLQFVDAAARFLGLPPSTLATDGHQAFGVQAGEAMVRLRLAHTQPAQ